MKNAVDRVTHNLRLPRRVKPTGLAHGLIGADKDLAPKPAWTAPSDTARAGVIGGLYERLSIIKGDYIRGSFVPEKGLV
jgi:hypothetical protein